MRSTGSKFQATERSWLSYSSFAESILALQSLFPAVSERLSWLAPGYTVDLFSEPGLQSMSIDF